MPSREPELYKDKIEVSLDGRQIFYLFFGGAVIVGLVFVVGVMVGRRVESRSHVDRAETQTASDPLAALDRLERSDHLSFHGALTGNPAPSDVEKAIGELEKRRAAGKADAAKPDAKAAVIEPGSKADADKPKADKRDGDKRDGDKRDADKRDADKKTKKHDDKDDRSASRSEARADSKSDGKSDKADKQDSKSDSKSDKAEAKADARPDIRSEIDGKPKADKTDAKVRFTLQLSSFQDKGEAESFLSSIRSAGFQPYLTEADVTGKGTFYRVRLGSYRSLEAASDAKAEYEKAAKKSAQVMRL